MTKLRKAVRLATVAVFVTATSAVAQDTHPQVRDGFTVSFGFGGGSAGATCGGCNSDREKAPSGYLRLGGAVRPNLIIGGEVNGWSKKETDQGFESTVTIATVNAIAQWYPQTTTGFFLIGGVGLGSMEVKATATGLGSFSDRTNGLGYQVGTGYDIRLARNFSLTPFVTYFATAGGTVESSNEKANGNVFHFGIGFTWH
jgi:hypothetical protein